MIPALAVVPYAFDPAGSQVLTGSGEGFELLFFAFAAFAAVFLAWLLVNMMAERLTFETVLCPVRGRVAEVVFRRTMDGTRLDVVSCSLCGRGRSPRCGRECLRRSA